MDSGLAERLKPVLYQAVTSGGAVRDTGDLTDQDKQALLKIDADAWPQIVRELCGGFIGGMFAAAWKRNRETILQGFRETLAA